MANLTSSAPAAFDNLLGFIEAAAGTSVTVVDSELEQYEPGTYVELVGIEEYIADISAISYLSMVEDYEIKGLVRVYIGGSAEPKNVRDLCFSTYQTYVITPIVANPTLGVNNPGTQILKCLPYKADYHGTIQGNGWQGLLEFSLQMQARITV